MGGVWVENRVPTSALSRKIEFKGAEWGAYPRRPRDFPKTSLFSRVCEMN